MLADWGLRITAFLELHRQSGPDSDSAWHVATAVYVLPFILLAPFNGCLSNSLPRRWVLVGAAVGCLVALLAFTPYGPWVTALGFVALGSALYSASRYAVLPAIAQDTKLPLNTISGLIELGSLSAVAAGIIIGLQYTDTTPSGIPVAVVICLALSCIVVVAALPCSFRSDVARPESPLRAVVGFFRDCKRIFDDPESRWSLLAQSVFQGLVVAASGATFTAILNTGATGAAMHSMIAMTVGLALGCSLAAGQTSTYRSLGLVPLGLTGLVLAQAWAASTSDDGIVPVGPSLLMGILGGAITVPLRAAYQAAVPSDARGNAMSVMNTVIYILTGVIALMMYYLSQTRLLTDVHAQMWFLTCIIAASAALAWRVLFPQTLELLLEWIMLPIYRVHVRGPGIGKIPLRGPLLLIANHSAYLDPFWIGKITPRHVRPMMTSKFYDVPIIHWIVKNVVRAIRVQVGKFRREAPELQIAIEALRNGECVLVYPEGILRRKEEKILRLFGQGVWHMLRELPETPVVVFWIEGGWGSYTSYKNGPPMTNKKRDFFHRIDIAIEEPQVLPPEVLADQRATRLYLMRACLEARRHLGLPVPLDVLPAVHDEMEDVDETSVPSE
jgi:1-acyl-sn-glycerol-3-phosphate acyltransferase/MFS family permease